jgi:hypothetical protein
MQRLSVRSVIDGMKKADLPSAHTDPDVDGAATPAVETR